MRNEVKGLREFGRFRLDVQKKVLWHEDEPVNLPLKEIELLCVLTENSGEVVTKNELLEKVWADSFVEESNLSRHIYLLRKTFKDFGESEDLIQTVPRRGYRFAGDIRESGNGELVIEKHTLTQTLIEEEPATRPQPRAVLTRSRLVVLLGVLILVLAIGIAFLRYRPNASGGSGVKSIAVLPFKTIGAEKKNDHQGLGTADLLITRLSNLKEITVRPTTAVMAFENYVEDSVAIGKKLQVDAVLEGTIYRTAGNVRVTVRLVRVSDQSSIWTGLVEKPLADEFRLQNEIVLQVVNALSLNLSGNEKDALTKRYTENAEAYQLYVRGRYEWNKRTPAAMNEAERLFRNAIEKDPNFALAYVGVADYLVMGADAAETSIALTRALELDPNLAEAYATFGFNYTFHTWDWQAAEVNFKRSIELNPGYATAHHWYSILLAIQGRTDEAKSEMRRALEINPTSHNFLADLGQLHYFAREYDKAEEYCRKALEIYPEFMNAHDHLYRVYLQTGEHDKVIDEYIEFAKSFASFAGQTDKDRERWLTSVVGIREAYQQRGIRGYLESRLSFKGSDSNIFHYNAMWYAFLGEKEKALDNLEKAYVGRAFLLVFVKADPAFDPLRKEPRYQAILRGMNLE